MGGSPLGFSLTARGGLDQLADDGNRAHQKPEIAADEPAKTVENFQVNVLFFVGLHGSGLC